MLDTWAQRPGKFILRAFAFGGLLPEGYHSGYDCLYAGLLEKVVINLGLPSYLTTNKSGTPVVVGLLPSQLS